MSLKIEGNVPGFQNHYHFHASPKYRADIFTKDIANRAQELFLAKAQELNWNIHAIAVDNDHIHFLIESNSTPSDIAQRLFGFTSFTLRKEFPELKDLNKDHFWGGRQCKCISNEEHLTNTIKYIAKHKNV